MGGSLTAVLVDDEFWARENLRDLLVPHALVRVVGEAATVEEARRLIVVRKPDVVFLDINLGRGTGFDVLDGLAVQPRVVFVTAYDEFAVRAFEVNALDYLLKPIDHQRLAQAVDRLIAGRQPVPDAPPMSMADRIFVSSGARCLLLPMDEIAAVKSERNCTFLFTTHREEPFKVRQPFHAWPQCLPFPPFVRLDRSTIVNVALISDLALDEALAKLHYRGLAVPMALGRTAATRLRRHLTAIHGSP